MRRSRPGSRTKAVAAKNDRDRNKLMEATQAMEKLRPEFLTRVEGILTDVQKTLTEVRGDAGPARTRPGVAPVRPGAAAAETPGKILSPQLQERLNLSAEQKRTLEDLQKEVDAKFKSLLTEEQRKLLDPQGGTTPPNKKRPTVRPQTSLESTRVAPTFETARARLDVVFADRR